MTHFGSGLWAMYISRLIKTRKKMFLFLNMGYENISSIYTVFVIFYLINKAILHAKKTKWIFVSKKAIA